MLFDFGPNGLKSGNFARHVGSVHAPADVTEDHQLHRRLVRLRFLNGWPQHGKDQHDNGCQLQAQQRPGKSFRERRQLNPIRHNHQNHQPQTRQNDDRPWPNGFKGEGHEELSDAIE